MGEVATMIQQITAKYISIFLIATFLLCGCNKIDSSKPNESEIFVMDTYVSQKIYATNPQKISEEVNQFLIDCENKLSLYKENSYVAKINQNAGQTHVPVDDFTFNLIKQAVTYSKLSNGVFDITIAPLSKLWGITNENTTIPSKENIDKAKKLVNYKNVVCDDKDKSIFLKEKGMSIDLGGIAKGYLCKNILELYEKNDVNSAIVSVGGNVFAYKQKPDKTDYSLGIRDPQKTENDIFGKLKITDKVVATSGAYERFFKKNGTIYHHILDVKNGYPCKSDLQSVTVVSDNGGLADFLSTTFFIAGKEKSLEYLKEKNFSLILIDTENNIYISDNIKEKFELTCETYKIKADN